MILRGVKPAIQHLAIGNANRPEKGGVCGGFPFLWACPALIQRPLRGGVQPTHARVQPPSFSFPLHRRPPRGLQCHVSEAPGPDSQLTATPQKSADGTCFGRWGGQGCIRRKGTSEAAPEAVRQADGGGLPKRLGAVTVGYCCHSAWHLPSGGQWLGIGWAPWRGATSPPSNSSLRGGGGGGSGWWQE